MLVRLFLSVFIYLSLIMSVQAAECRATFADGLTNSSNDGKIKFEDSAQLLNNPDAILATTDIDNSGNVPRCGGASCSASGTIVPQLNSSYVKYSSSNNLVVDATTQTISANDYKDVTVKSGGSLYMSATYSSYHFNKLKVEDSSVIYLTAGDYFVEEIEIKDASQLIVQGSGTARIYIKKKAKFKESSVINGGASGDPSRLVLYSFDDVTVESAASLAGYIYSEKKVEIKDSSKVLGAISSEDELKLKDNSSVSYDDSIDDTDFGSMCDSSTSSIPGTPLLEYRFDELSWNGSPNQVIDSSGNNNNGTAVGGITTATGKICNAADIPNNNSASTFEAVDTGVDLDTIIGSSGTISLWYKGNRAWNSGSDKRLFDATDGNKYFFAEIRSDGRVKFWFEDGRDGDYQKTTVSAFAVDAGVWKHLTFVWDVSSSTAKIFVDGIEQGVSGGIGGTTAFTGYDTLYFGDNRDASYLTGQSSADGLIDEALVFDSVLTSAQIQTIFTNQDAGNNYDGTSRRCGLAVPVVNYRFDSCNWADAQNVVDSSPNRLDAYAVNGVLSTVGGQVCGLAQFDSADDYVRLPDTNEVDLPDTLTAMAWVYLKNTPAELKTILSKDTNYEFHVNSSRQIYWWWQDSNNTTRSFSSTTQVSLNKWHHVAITYQSGLQIIYIDGQEAARQTFTGQLITNSNDLQIGQDQGIGSRFFDGDIDEVKIFDVALSSSEVEEIVANEKAGNNYDGTLRSCNCVEPVAVDHYAITHDQSMVSCLSEDITFTAHDNADLAVDAKDAVLQISTSTMKGEWLSVVAGSGVLGNSGSGQASYRFPDNGETSVTLRFSYPDLAADPEIVNFNVTDGFSTDMRNSSHLEDENLSVSDSGLIFSIPDTQSCQASLTVSIQAVKKSDDSLSCSGAVAGNRTVNFYSQYLTPSAGTQTLVLTSDGVAYPLSSSAPGTPVAVRFDAQGEASMSIQYPDAGVVGLSAALAVGQKTLYGSDSFVAYPASLSLVADNGSGLMLDNTAVSGGAVWAAARPFSVRVSGQCADGTETPNYQPSNAQLGMSLHTPTQAAGGVGGSFSVSAASQVVSDGVGWIGISSGFSAGVFADASASYSEVGTINLYARDSDYHGHAISQSATTLGRFVPWFFGVTANSPEWGAHCPSADFSYMDEDIEYEIPPELVVSGFNAIGGRVYNYGGPLWKLAAQRSGRLYTDLSATVSATLSSTIDVSSGTWGGTDSDYDGMAINTLTGDSIKYVRGGVEAPFDGRVDLTLVAADLTDTDGACYRIDADADGDWLDESCSGFTISNIPAKELRFGRLRLADAYGPETEPLSLPWVTEYYDGSDFVINSMDSCSAWLTSEVTYSDNDGALIGSGQTVAAYAYSGTDFRVEAGDAGVTMGSPGAGNTGTIGVVVDLTRMPYFFFDWDGDGSFDDAPSANLIFGQYRSNDRVIFQRQW